MADHWWPYGTGEIVACRADAHRNSAPTLEPMRDVRDQRAETGRRAEPEQAIRDGELPRRRRHPAQEIAEAHRERAADEGDANAEVIGEPAGEDRAEREPDHQHRVGQRGFAAGDAEIGLDRRQHHHERPHAHAADRADQRADGKPQPGIARIGRVRGLACSRAHVIRLKHGPGSPGARRNTGVSRRADRRSAMRSTPRGAHSEIATWCFRTPSRSDSRARSCRRRESIHRARRPPRSADIPHLACSRTSRICGAHRPRARAG